MVVLVVTLVAAPVAAFVTAFLVALFVAFFVAFVVAFVVARATFVAVVALFAAALACARWRTGGLPAAGRLPVISAALFARFSSRQDDSPAMKAVAALRNQFGGHAVQSSETS